MPSWWDSLFGDVPLPARPTSRGSTMGLAYQGMPDMKAGIEDRRTGVSSAGAPQSTPYNLNAQILSNYPPGSHAYNVDQWQWLQKHMPEDAPTTRLQDPDFSLDPSIMARSRAREQAQLQNRADWMQPPVIPTGPRSGPRFSDARGLTLNSSPWGM